MLAIPSLSAWDALHPAISHLPVVLLLVAPLCLLLAALLALSLVASLAVSSAARSGGVPVHRPGIHAKL